MDRCSKCLLPASLPGNIFNEFHECLWCQRNFPNYVPKGIHNLKELLDKYRSRTMSADCLVALSGGKDSSYALLELQQTFGMKVEAYTYDHYGLFSFALQNARVICENLDIKHHIVSLPHQAHLKSFKTFFQAWIKSPNTVSAAMTCVACKHLHLLGAELAIKRRIPMIVWSVCPLEYSPFTAIKQSKTEAMAREGLLTSAIRLSQELLRCRDLCEGILRHLGLCFSGCLAFSPTSKYLSLRYPSLKHIFFFDFCDWQPDVIVRELVARAGWSPPQEVVTDWHSDCVFNIFKEYMFQKMLGVSYMDAFLSNQIRYGILTRKEGWDILVKSKIFFAEKLLEAIKFVGLKHLTHLIDLSCFDIS